MRGESVWWRTTPLSDASTGTTQQNCNRLQVLLRIDIAKNFRFCECQHGVWLRKAPAFDLGVAGLHGGIECGLQGAVQQQAKCLQALTVVGDGEQAFGVQAVVKFLREVGGQQGAVAGDDHDPIVAAVGQGSLYAGERAGKVAVVIGDYRPAKLCVLFMVAIGADDNIVDLRAQAA